MVIDDRAAGYGFPAHLTTLAWSSPESQRDKLEWSNAQLRDAVSLAREGDGCMLGA